MHDVKTLRSNAGGVGLTTHQGASIPHAKKTKHKTDKEFNNNPHPKKNHNGVHSHIELFSSPQTWKVGAVVHLFYRGNNCVSGKPSDFCKAPKL